MSLGLQLRPSGLSETASSPQSHVSRLFYLLYNTTVVSPMVLSRWEVAKIILAPVHALAILACITRLVYRKRTCRLWWDDFWALVALLCECTTVVAYGIRKVQETDAHTANILRRISLAAFTSTLWGARLSIAVSIVRLVPPGPGRHIAKGVSALFVLMWIGLLIQTLFICGGGSVNVNIARCHISKTTGILELCTSLAADMWLICSPAYLLWGAKLSRKRRILIFSVFASNVLLTTTSIVRSVLIFKQKGPWIGVFAQIEVAIYLMMCNLLVLVTWMYSRIYPNEGDEDSTTTSEYLTTRRTRRPDAPNYGFEGSVLVLTEMSDTSVSLLGTFENPPSNATLGYNRHKPRSRTLNALYPSNPSRPATIPYHLRPSRSCPALLNVFVPRTSGKAGDNHSVSRKSSSMNNGAVAEVQSLAFRTETGDWSLVRNEILAQQERRMTRQMHRQRR